MKKSKVIIPAMAMILFSTAASITGTVAWFSLNRTVTVTGMQVTTKVNDNLLISPATMAGTTKNAENTFVNSVIQTRSGVLEPVSSIDGKSFWYTSATNVQANGAVIDADEYVAYVEDDAYYKVADDADTPKTSAAKDNIDAAFNTAYGVESAANVAFGYIDYVTQLKAVNTGGTNDIRLTQLDLIYDGARDASKAYRVGVFVEDWDTSSAFTAAPGTLKKIYSVSGATYFTSGEAVSATNALSTVSTVDNVIAEISGSVTKYYKVVVRLWLEGEDNTCNNEIFMELTDHWNLDLEMKLVSHDSVVEGERKVANISKYTHANISATDYYCDGTNVWTNLAKIHTNDTKTALSASSDDVKLAFGHTWAVTHNLTNVTATAAKSEAPKDNAADFALATSYAATGGKDLPTNVTMTIGGNPATKGTDYTWTAGVLTILAGKATGDIVVTIAGV